MCGLQYYINPLDIDLGRGGSLCREVRAARGLLGACVVAAAILGALGVWDMVRVRKEGGKREEGEGKERGSLGSR